MKLEIKHQISFLLFSILETCLRMFPIPAKTGLYKIGNPDELSPVLLTCNYHLTVLRVKHALRGLDCYLLVANSKGVNVWCASAGGLMTNHSIVSVIKTSRIEKHVKHRQLILPKLAACGIEAKVVHEKTGWQVIWGPVYAEDLKQFIQDNYHISPNMQTVVFNFWQRVEMGITLAFPISVIFTVIYAIWWRKEIWQLILLIWCLYGFVFILFPLYQEVLFRTKDKMTTLSLAKNLLLGGFFWLLATSPFLIVYIINNKDLSYLLHWSITTFFLILFSFMDIGGMTPLYKADMIVDTKYSVKLEQTKCILCLNCERVCPKACFTHFEGDEYVSLVHQDECIRCGACIIQCPTDALLFVTKEGIEISPNQIRKYKLNMLGKRAKIG
ncbi:MAG: HgcAB-like fusion protein [Candidatus Heimdallarchaeaceae archaeon]